MFETSVLFTENYNSKAQVVINQGGTGAGKTFAIMQVLFAKATETPKQIITIIGQDVPNLKAGPMRDAQQIVDSSPVLQQALNGFNKSDRVYLFNNGSILEFKSYDSPQDAKSGKRAIAFFNEANGIPYPIFKEIYLRTSKQTFLDFNPNSSFWCHDNLLGKPNVEVLISDHRHNPFLSDQQRATIEALKNEDEELWKVYARGMTGKIEGLVYRNWSICEAIPADAKFIAASLDFGFTQDPSAVLEVYQQNGELWVHELLYETGLTNPAIVEELEAVGFDKRRDIIADSAEPKSIVELKQMGLKVEPAQKGPDSILNGIDILKRYHINVTRSSVNLRKELSNYKWKVDKLTGKGTNTPIDAFCHLLDGLRYVALNRLALKPEPSRPKVKRLNRADFNRNRNRR